MPLATRLALYHQVLTDVLLHGGTLAEETGIVSKLAELHVAVAIGGTMAATVNQRGYDVLSPTGQRISVKCRTRLNGYFYFNPRTFEEVDRVILVRVAADQAGKVTATILFDGSSEQARAAAYTKATGMFYIDPLAHKRNAAALADRTGELP